MTICRRMIPRPRPLYSGTEGLLSRARKVCTRPALQLCTDVHSYTHDLSLPTTPPAGVYQLRKHYDKLSRENVNDVRLITKPYPKIEGAVQIEMTPDLKALLEACVAAVRVANANADALTELHQRAHHTPHPPF